MFLSLSLVCESICVGAIYQRSQPDIILKHKANLEKTQKIQSAINYDPKYVAVVEENVKPLTDFILGKLCAWAKSNGSATLKDYWDFVIGLIETQQKSYVEEMHVLFSIVNDERAQTLHPLFTETIFAFMLQLHSVTISGGGEIILDNCENYQCAVKLLINHAIRTKQPVGIESINIEPLVDGLLAFYKNVSISAIKETLPDFLKFCENHAVDLQQMPTLFCNYLPKESDITPDQRGIIYLRMLLILQRLTEYFPRRTDSLFNVLIGLKDSQISILSIGKPFNSSYESQTIFDIFSRRIAFFLSSAIKEDVNDLSKIFLWTGFARSVVDMMGKLLHQKPLNTLFGNFPTRCLEEPWSLYPAPDRFFAIKTFCTENLLEGKKAEELTGMDVFHMEALYGKDESKFLENMDDFLTYLRGCINSSDNWQDNLLRFIYRFAISSTFSRGQSSIIEWWSLAVADRYNTKILYTYSGIDSIPFRYVSEKFPGRHTFRDIINYIYDNIYGGELNKLETILKQIAREFYDQICNKDDKSLTTFSWYAHYAFQQEIFAEEFHNFLLQIIRLTIKNTGISEDISCPKTQQQSCNVYTMWSKIYNNIKSLIRETVHEAVYFDNDKIYSLCANTAKRICIRCSEEYLKSIFTHLDVVALDIYYFSHPASSRETEERFLTVAKELIKFENALD